VKELIATRLLRDRDGGVWIATSNRGLVHVHQEKTEAYASSDGLSGDHVINIFEDREGSIWAATVEGLDRFRDPAVPTISVRQGLSSTPASPVLATADGSVWLGTKEGLNKWSYGQVTIYPRPRGSIPYFQDPMSRIWASGAYGIESVGYYEN